MRKLTTGLAVAAPALGAQSARSRMTRGAAGSAGSCRDRGVDVALRARSRPMDADGYAAVYTEDGTFGSGSTQRKGRADHQGDGRRSQERPRRACGGRHAEPSDVHVIANHQVTFTGPNEARYDSIG